MGAIDTISLGIVEAPMGHHPSQTVLLTFFKGTAFGG